MGKGATHSGVLAEAALRGEEATEADSRDLRELTGRATRAWVAERLGGVPESFDHEFEELGRTLEWRGVRPDEAWCRTLIDRLTVRHTQWMRHPSQFERLERWLNTTISRPVLVWSAGCARGLEPLSIAEVAHRIGVECRILATDVSRAALAEARGAVSESAYRAVIEFRAHSIHGDLVPAESPFDLVFCRNVLMYAQADRAQEALSRLGGCVKRNGALVVSPVESLLGAPIGFQGTDTLGWFDQISASASVAPPRGVLDSVSLLKLAHEAPLLGALLGSGDSHQAEQEAKSYVEEHGDDPFGWFTLGEILRQRGEAAQSMACYERVVERVGSEPSDARLNMLREATTARLSEE